MEILKSTDIFFSIILTIGLFTTFTDLKHKKIYNTHIVIGAVLGLAAIVYAAAWGHERIMFHFINGLIASVIAILFYHFDLWKGGDTKLFTLFAFLMPPLEEGTTIFSCAINLFACSFIAGAIILLPVFIKDFASNKKDEFKHENLKKPFNTIRLTIIFSWMLFPLYYFLTPALGKTIHAPILLQIITYAIFYLIRRFLKKIMTMNRMIVLSGITFGFVMRLWLNPYSLSWPVLPYSILKLTLYSGLSACIYAVQTDFKKYRERIPFAPLLFVGCLLSYTPFLTWLMQKIYR